MRSFHNIEKSAFKRHQGKPVYIGYNRFGPVEIRHNEYNEWQTYKPFGKSYIRLRTHILAEMSKQLETL